MHPRTEEPIRPLAFAPRDAARTGGVGINAIYLAMSSGKLPARKLGRRTLILAADLEAWLLSLPSMKEAA